MTDVEAETCSERRIGSRNAGWNPIELRLPRFVTSDLRCFRTLVLDEQCIPMRVIVELTLRVKPFLELFTLTRFVREFDEVVNPISKHLTHLICSCLRSIQQKSILFLCFHHRHREACTMRPAPNWGQKIIAVLAV